MGGLSGLSENESKMAHPTTKRKPKTKRVKKANMWAGGNCLRSPQPASETLTSFSNGAFRFTFN